jgi:HlyD family secretion protein
MNKATHRWLTLIVFVSTLSGCEAENGERRLVGQLESDRIEITAEVSEPIVERAVVEGESVESGQLLIRQDTSRIEARIVEAEANTQQTRARLDELIRGPRKEQIVAARANVDGATRELKFRETELQRTQSLFERELASPDVRDRAQAAKDQAQANLDNLEARLDELLSGTTVEELRQAEEAVRVAEARVESLLIDRRRHSAVAPSAGVVDSLLFEPGERPAVGQPMAILLSGEQAYARIYIPESIRVKVAPGVSARIYVDGMERVVDGVVRWVSIDAAFTPYFALTEDDRGRLSYAAKVDIIGEQRRLPDGVPVEVELLLGRDEN